MPTQMVVNMKRTLVVQYGDKYQMSAVHLHTATASLIVSSLGIEYHHFRSCRINSIPPFFEWESEVVIMDCGNTLPKEYEGKVEVMRAVWDCGGNIAYVRPVRPDEVRFI